MQTRTYSMPTNDTATTATVDSLNLKTKGLNEIAAIIEKDWKAKAKNGIYFGAKPYLEAMSTLVSITDNYVADSGRSIVAYFLANATTWKGDVAREVKKHLNGLLKFKI